MTLSLEIQAPSFYCEYYFQFLRTHYDFSDYSKTFLDEHVGATDVFCTDYCDECMRKREIMGHDPYDFEFPVPRCLVDLTQTHATLLDRDGEPDYVHNTASVPICNSPITMKKFSPQEVFR